MSWDTLLRRAALEFAMPPAAFWALSLKEWRALTTEPPGPQPLGRTDFEALRAAHPDHRQEAA